MKLSVRDLDVRGKRALPLAHAPDHDRSMKTYLDEQEHDHGQDHEQPSSPGCGEASEQEHD